MEAAKLLARAVSKPLGSAELDLVAKGDWGSADAADKPYFYIARVRASEKATTAEIRERLLRNALDDTPERDAARLPLFFAFVNAGKDQLAISAIQPVMNTGLLQTPYRGTSEAMPAEQEETDSEETVQAAQEETPQTPIRPDNQLEKSSHRSAWRFPLQ